MNGTVHGPLWTAEVVISQDRDPPDDWGVRSVFVDTVEARDPGLGRQGVAPPGTLLIKCAVQRVTLTAGEQRITINTSDQPVWLEVASAQETRLGVGRGEFACLNGEIPLVGGDEIYRWLRMSRGAGGGLTANGSGIAVRGQVELPWVEPGPAAALAGTFQLSAPGSGWLRLAPQLDQMTPAEIAAFADSWERLAERLDPASGPRWVALTAAATGPPRIHWGWRAEGAAARPDEVTVAPGQLTVTLRDQRARPATQASVALDEARIRAAPGHLEIAVEGGTSRVTTDALLAYAFDDAGEKFTLTDAELAFDPVRTPQALREWQGLPEPRWGGKPLTDPVVWAYVPLADGWAQLPVPNLTEEIYLDADLEAAPPAAEPTEQAGVMQGAVAYGNAPDGKAADAGEQPWQLTLVGAGHVEGTWHLDSAGISSVALRLRAPDVAVTGFLWFSTGRPTAADALPGLDDWVAGLETVPLRSFDAARDVLPPLMRVKLGVASTDSGASTTFSARDDGETTTAALDEWSVGYRVHGATLEKMCEKKVLAKDQLERSRPWVWRRHPNVPTVQALPMTQTLSPPNHPSASRQLMPLIHLSPAPWDLNFEKPTGSGAWPVVHDPTVPVKAWPGGLPIASLTLPGAVLRPGDHLSGLAIRAADAAEPVPEDPVTGLRAQYRFDLPYLDELHALAQVPKDPPRPGLTSPAPAAPPAEPPKPLSRATFPGHWGRLAEQAALAAADAVDVFAADADDPTAALVDHLIEPYRLVVTAPAVDLTTYPGSLHAPGLGAVEPLRGVTGGYRTDGRTLILDPQGQLSVEAGSLQAWRDDDGRYHDQRGLARLGSTAERSLLRTPVRSAMAGSNGQPDDVTLLSTLQPIPLAVAAGDPWQLWFRDVPVGADDGFRRSDAESGAAQDVNDPQALSRARDYLAGYEWRLGRAGPGPAHLPLCGLHFYPLALDALELRAGEIDRVEISGRLQLPLETPREQAGLDNAVTVVFTRGTSGLELSDVKRDATATAEWPLAAAVPDAGDAPRIEWDEIEYGGGKLSISEPYLSFHLFDLSCRVRLDAIELADGTGSLTIGATGLDPADDRQLSVAGLEVTLDPVASSHDARLHLALGYGAHGGDEAVLTATVDIDLVQLDTDVTALRLLRALPVESGNVWLRRGGLQFEFSAPADAPPVRRLELLPGMHLAADRPVTGFAALSFDVGVETKDAGLVAVPVFTVQTGFQEAQVFCRWGSFVQDQGPGTDAGDHLFASSAGDLAVGLTSEYRRDAWHDTILLNGFMEVTNLVSWPAAMLDSLADDTPETLTVPSVAEARNAGLEHLRHTMRILFNEHVVPQASVEPGPDPSRPDDSQPLLVLRDAAAWQFLAVVEHQLLRMAQAGNGWERKAAHRWTTMQEVRLVAPKHFAAFLRRRAAAAAGSGAGPHIQGYLQQQVAGTLASAIEGLDPRTVIVEASAPHFVNQDDLGLLASTALQYLPNGTLHGMLTSPSSYAARAQDGRGWVHLTLPMLGRLQDQRRDTADGPPLTADPVRRLAVKASNHAPIVRTLANVRSAVGPPVTVSPIDADPDRTWGLLDAATLEENWYRIQHPPPEVPPDGLASVLASFSEGPARSSRAAALQQGFDSFRPAWAGEDDMGDSGYLPGGWARDEQPGARQDVAAWQVLEIPDGAKPRETARYAAPQVHRLKPRRTGYPVLALEYDNPHMRAALVRDLELPAGSYRFSVWVFADDRLATPHRSIDASTVNRARPADDLRLFAQVPRAFDAPDATTRPDTDATCITAQAPGDGTTFEERVAAGSGYWQRLTLVFEVPGPCALVRLGIAAHPVHGLHDNVWYFDAPQLLQLSAPGAAREAAPPFTVGDDIVWRRDGLLVSPARLTPVEPELSFHATAPQLAWTWAANGSAVSRHAAATVLPAKLSIGLRNNPQPVSFAVSPYAGLAMHHPPSTTKQQTSPLVAAELLCVAEGALRPVATFYWERPPEGGNLDEAITEWARVTHAKQCPTSPLAVVRRREIHRTTGAAAGEALVTTAYTFMSVEPPDETRLATRTAALRSDVRQLRFSQGQFGGLEMPAGSGDAFELAPPQVVGVQPLHITTRPAAPTPAHWPWGLSGLLVWVRYGDGPAIGPVTTGRARLWWQAAQRLVQFRAAKGQTAGLPAYFRAPAIKTLLPVVPNVPLPVLDVDALEGWQPVLPSTVRFMITGSRPGVMTAMRYQLLSQALGSGPGRRAGPALGSGSVPIQHRMPRPVPLPDNRAGAETVALQPWARYHEPERLVLATTAPADTAFFAAPVERAAAGNRALRLTSRRHALEQGATSWTLDIDEAEAGPATTWSYSCRLAIRGVAHGAAHAAKDTLRVQIDPGLLDGLAEGEVVTLVVDVASSEDGFAQTLRFPVRVANQARLPLRPRYALFEDPEYNRKLVSAAAQAFRTVATADGVQHTVTLATDRKQYNPDSTVFVRHDWSDGRTDREKLTLARVTRDGVVVELPKTLDLTPGELGRLSLVDVGKLEPGDVLQLALDQSKAVLRVDIVDQPVTPKPEAAYGLLRRNADSSVECVRFAWGPDADRVDLVCADDLRSGVVRRRAVFRWSDVARPGSVAGYAVQKIGPRGSTHIPAPKAFSLEA